jgi:hypothetical protein
MFVKEITFILNIICLIYHTYCVLNGILVGMNLFGIFTILQLLLLIETNRKIIFNTFIVIHDLIIINIQLIFWIGLIYIILSSV